MGKPKHGPNYTCYKAGAPSKAKKAKATRTKQIADGKKRAREAARLAAQH